MSASKSVQSGPTQHQRLSEVEGEFKAAKVHGKIAIFAAFDHRIQTESQALQKLFFEAAINESKSGSPVMTAIMLRDMGRSVPPISYHAMNSEGIADPFVEALRVRIREGWVHDAIYTMQIIGMPEIGLRLQDDIVAELRQMYADQTESAEALKLAEIMDIDPKEIRFSGDCIALSRHERRLHNMEGILRGTGPSKTRGGW